MPNENEELKPEKTEECGAARAASCSPKNGAFVNKYGKIYLRTVSWDTTSADWKLRTVDHGISIEEAHCIAADLMVAIQEASRMATGRANETTLPTAGLTTTDS
jgi:hypothetical protein